MSQLNTGKIKEAVCNGCKELEEAMKLLKDKGGISELVLKKLEKTMQVLVELKEIIEPISAAPSFSEADMKDLMDMLYISRSLENMKNDTKKRNQWKKECSSITNKNIRSIQNAAPLFLGREDGIKSYEDLSTSYVQHAHKFLYRSNENIDGRDISYSGYRDLVKAIGTSGVFKLTPEKKRVEVVSEVSLNIQDVGRHAPIIVKTEPIISINKEMFIISVLCDGKVYKYSIAECFDNKFLSYKPYQRTLEEYLDSNPLRNRMEPLFQSKVCYPNKYVKGLIQGLLSAVVERITSKKPHDYLIHPQNILLHEPIYPPYPPSYYSTPKLLTYQDMILKNANEKRQYVVPVSFVRTTCSEKMEDFDAVYELIFEKILKEKDESPPDLPQDWQLLKKALADGTRKVSLVTNESSYYEKMSSSIVLRDWQDQLNLLMYAYHLNFYSTPQMRSRVQGALNNIDILRKDWCTVVKQVEKSWNDVYFYEGRTFTNGQVDDLLKYFRNLVTHGEKTKTQAYLAYKISCVFPEMLPQIHQRLLEIGVKY